MKTILIVDDEQTIRRLLTKYLSDAGFRCLVAASVQEAKTQLHTEKIDLLLSDIHMPGETGVDLARYVKREFPDLPIVIISIIDNPVIAKEVFELNAYGYIVKPFTRNLVRITVDNAIRRHQLEQQTMKYQAGLEQLVYEKTEEIRSQVTLLESVMNAIPSAVFEVQKDGEILGCNNVFAQLLGLKTSDVVGNKIADLGCEELARIAELSSGELFNPDLDDFEICLNDAVNNPLELLVKKTIITSRDVAVESVVSVLVDITERKKLERVLKTSERKYRQIVDNINIGVALLNPNLEVLQMNPQMSKWFPGVQPGKGFLCYQSFHENPHEEPCPDCPTVKTFAEGKSFENIIRTKGNKIARYFRDFSSPVFDDEGRIVAAILLVEEVTQKLSLERELRQAQKLEAIGQLAAGIAHEINTPIQYIGDNIRFLQDSFSDIDGILDICAKIVQTSKQDENKNKKFHTADLECLEKSMVEADIEFLQEELPQAIRQGLKGVQRVSEIVGAMRDFSHPGTDKKTLVDINQAISNTVTVARNEWKYVAELELDLDTNLPEVKCLVGEINQVILNLIVNAAHAIEEAATSRENDKGKITIVTLNKGDHIEIQVTDTGTGIPEDIRHRVFDPFFTTKEVGSGTGQGLSIGHRVITEKHGGSLSFTTKSGVGTTFCISLPVSAAS